MKDVQQAQAVNKRTIPILANVMTLLCEFADFDSLRKTHPGTSSRLPLSEAANLTFVFSCCSRNRFDHQGPTLLSLDLFASPDCRGQGSISEYMYGLLVRLHRLSTGSLSSMRPHMLQCLGW
jgi:hypothetical protein